MFFGKKEPSPLARQQRPARWDILTKNEKENTGLPGKAAY